MRSTLLFLAILLAACGSSTSGPAGEAELRVLHATPNLGSLDVDVGGATVVRGVSYGTTSRLLDVPAGEQHIVVRSAGQVLGELTATLSLQHLNSIVVADGTPRFVEQVTPDTGQVISNRANIRMVNVVGPTSVPPTLLAVKVAAPNANPDSVISFGMDATIASYSTLMYFDPGHFSFRYLPSGGSTVLAETAFDVAAGETKTVVLERGADGVYRVQVLIEH